MNNVASYLTTSPDPWVPSFEGEKGEPHQFTAVGAATAHTGGNAKVYNTHCISQCHQVIASNRGGATGIYKLSCWVTTGTCVEPILYSLYPPTGTTVSPNIPPIASLNLRMTPQ